MSKETPAKLVTFKTVIFDLIATAIFFFVMLPIIRPHVPAHSEPWLTIWTVFTTLCLAGTFFLASCMFHAVLVDQLRRKKSN